MSSENKKHASLQQVHDDFYHSVCSLVSKSTGAQATHVCITAYFLRATDDRLRTLVREKLASEIHTAEFHLDHVVNDFAGYIFGYTTPYEQVSAAHALQYGLASQVRLPDAVPTEKVQEMLSLFIRIFRDQMHAVLWCYAKFKTLNVPDETELKAVMRDFLGAHDLTPFKKYIDEKRIGEADIAVLQKNILVRDMATWWTAHSNMHELLDIVRQYKEAFEHTRATVEFEKSFRAWGDEHAIESVVKMIVTDNIDHAAVKAAREASAAAAPPAFDFDSTTDLPAAVIEQPKQKPQKEIDPATATPEEFEKYIADKLAKITELHIQTSRQVDTSVARIVLDEQISFVAQMNKYCTKDKRKFQLKTVLYGRLTMIKQVFTTMDRLLKINKTMQLVGVTMEDADYLAEQFPDLFIRQSSTALLSRDFLSESDLETLRTDPKVFGNTRLWPRVEEAYFQSTNQKIHYTKITDELAKLFYNRIIHEKNPVDSDSMGLIAHYGIFFPDKIRDCVNLMLLKREKAGLDIPLSVRSAVGFDNDEGVKRLRSLLMKQ
ncbi:MAG: hypothetical protein HZC28_08805 [Spirochaetes bacterium]|nr:hypothetical protein [Spirochaetota bacterium]